MGIGISNVSGHSEKNPEPYRQHHDRDEGDYHQGPELQPDDLGQPRIGPRFRVPQRRRRTGTVEPTQGTVRVGPIQVGAGVGDVFGRHRPDSGGFAAETGETSFEPGVGFSVGIDASLGEHH